VGGKEKQIKNGNYETYSAIKAHNGVEVWRHSFLKILLIYRHGQSAQYPSNRRLSEPQEQISTLWRRKNISPLLKINQLFLGCSPRSLSHYKDYDIMAPKIKKKTKQNKKEQKN
jgi:hypothetical protein